MKFTTDFLRLPEGKSFLCENISGMLTITCWTSNSMNNPFWAPSVSIYDLDSSSYYVIERFALDRLTLVNMGRPAIESISKIVRIKNDCLNRKSLYIGGCWQ